MNFHPLSRLRELPSHIALRDLDRQIANLSRLQGNAQIIPICTRRKRTMPDSVFDGPDGAA